MPCARVRRQIEHVLTSEEVDICGRLFILDSLSLGSLLHYQLVQIRNEIRQLLPGDLLL